VIEELMKLLARYFMNKTKSETLFKHLGCSNCAHVV